MKILVVDDDDLIRYLFEYKIKLKGHEVFCFPNGLETYRYVEAGQFPDLVITDIMMPKMNGIELAKAIKKLNKNIPIVAMTGGNTDFGAENNLLFILKIEKNSSIDILVDMIIRKVTNSQIS